MEGYFAVMERAAARGDLEEMGRALRMIGPTDRALARYEALKNPAPAEPTPAPAPANDPQAPRPPLKLRAAQTPPETLPDGSDWSTWLFMGGRGAGKTLAGAEWLADQAMALKNGRVALIGPTLHDVREVMIEGASGILNLPRWTDRDRPVYEPSRRRLLFKSGSVAHVFSAEDPDSLRGPQFSAAWADEFCAWPAVGARGAAETLAMVRMGLRLPGKDRKSPRLAVTTTPRPTRALIALRDERSCVSTHAGTADNAANLSPGFLEHLKTLYGGTRHEAQELNGQVIALDGALFTAEMMMRARIDAWRVTRDQKATMPDLGASLDKATQGLATDALVTRHSPLATFPPFHRIVVAIDPTTTAHGDACGIVVAGARLRADGTSEAVVLADLSARGLSPDGWARRAVAAAQTFKAHAIVAEVNQGGDMVSSVLRTAGYAGRVRSVRASRGKAIRAEPVAALYEQGRVRHASAFRELEEELMALGVEEGAPSLDRADALVWAITDLLVDRPGERGPRLWWG